MLVQMTNILEEQQEVHNSLLDQEANIQKDQEEVQNSLLVQEANILKEVDNFTDTLKQVINMDLFKNAVQALNVMNTIMIFVFLIIDYIED